MRVEGRAAASREVLLSVRLPLRVAMRGQRRRREMSPETELDQLDRDGFLVIPGALSPEEVERIRARLNEARERGWQEGLNPVGNMWFDRLLEQDPETFRPLIAHPSVRPYLEALMGPQCQLRSFRAHINPGPYHQEWHMDFYGYWEQPQGRLTLRGVGAHSTSYFPDNGPEPAYLKYV